MQPQPYKWAKQIGGIGTFAIITLEVLGSPTGENLIVEEYSGGGFTSQGYLEDVPKDGYDPWKIGVRNGLQYAFSLTENAFCVHIKSLSGLSTDTTPATTGYTAFRAFFDQINIQIDEEIISRLERFVLTRQARPYKDSIPDFFHLTLNEY